MHSGLLASLFLLAQAQESVEGSSGVLSTIVWLIEWILIGAIALLVLFIGRVVMFPSKPSKAVYKPKRKPKNIFLSPAELSKYDASDPNLPIYIALRGVIYDVSAKRDMYGTKGQGYNCFTGRDCSYALAKHSLDEESCKQTDISNLTKGEIDALDSWEANYRQKYDAVGTVVHSEQERAAKVAEEDKRYALETEQLKQTEEAAKKKAKL